MEHRVPPAQRALPVLKGRQGPRGRKVRLAHPELKAVKVYAGPQGNPGPQGPPGAGSTLGPSLGKFCSAARQPVLPTFQGGRTLYTGLSGAFELDAVPAGTYEIASSPRGWVLQGPGGGQTITLPSVAVVSGQTTDTGASQLSKLSTDLSIAGHAESCAQIVSVSSYPTCSAGACGSVQCKPGSANCDFQSTNGCDTDITTVKNCGACGVVCLKGQSCNSGVCS